MLLEAHAPPTVKHRPGDAVSLAAGAYALAAIAVVALVDLAWGLSHDDYSYVADTISDLAAGTYSKVPDLALKGFSIAAGVVGLALWRWKPGARNDDSWRWSIGCAVVCALAPVLYWIAAYDGYSGEPTGEMTIHLYLVYALGAGFPIAAWLLGPGFEAVSHRWRNLSLGLAAVWVIAAPYFMFMGTSWDGLYERGLAVLLLAWFAAAAWNLVRHGRGRA